MTNALQGSLEHFHPSEILQLLQLSQVTGRLELHRGDERVALFFERGRPVFARTSGLAVRVGEVLQHRGVVSAEQLADALDRQKAHPGRRLGSVLVDSGWATRDQVREAVHEVLRRIVYGLLLWREGTFRFDPGPAVIGEDIQLDLDLDRLILEGLRLADQARAARS